MKPSKDYKKQYNNLNFLSLVALLVFLPFIFLNAQTAEELSERINEKSADIEKLEKEIRVYQAELGTIGKQKASLSGSIKELDITKKKLNTDISITQTKVDRTNLTIKSLSSDINAKEGSISKNKDAIISGLRKTDELEQRNLVETILSGNKFTDIWNDIDNMLSLRGKIQSEILDLKEVKGELEDTRNDTVKAKGELVSLKSQLADQKKVVDNNSSEKNKLLAQTKNSESNYQTLLKNQLAKKAAFEKELRNFESQLKFVLDPAKLPSAGVLSWPLDYIFVTQQFGAKTGPHRTYASGHSGTDFRARTPQPVRAMADGIIKGTGNTDTACAGVSFGQWVFAEYNNGLSSTYGHLSIIKASEGQKVSRGDIVGYSGGTGRVTGPHLHVSLYVSSAVKVDTVPSLSCPGKILKQPIAATNAYLDPMFYLPPYTAPSQ